MFMTWDQCDQNFQNFPTLAYFKKSFVNFCYEFIQYLSKFWTKFGKVFMLLGKF